MMMRNKFNLISLLILTRMYFDSLIFVNSFRHLIFYLDVLIVKSNGSSLFVLLRWVTVKFNGSSSICIGRSVRESLLLAALSFRIDVSLFSMGFALVDFIPFASSSILSVKTMISASISTVFCLLACVFLE